MRHVPVKELMQGAVLGASLLGPLYALLFGVLAPTNDIRVRIPILIGSGINSLGVLIAVTVCAIATLLLWQGGRLSSGRVLGSLVAGAVIGPIVVGQSAVRRLPEIHSQAVGWGLVMLALLLAAVEVRRLWQASATDSSSKQSSRRVIKVP